MAADLRTYPVFWFSDTEDIGEVITLKREQLPDEENPPNSLWDVYERKQTYDNINSLWDVDDFVMPRAAKPDVGVLYDAMDFL